MNPSLELAAFELAISWSDLNESFQKTATWGNLDPESETLNSIEYSVLGDKFTGLARVLENFKQTAPHAELSACAQSALKNLGQTFLDFIDYFDGTSDREDGRAFFPKRDAGDQEIIGWRRALEIIDRINDMEGELGYDSAAMRRALYRQISPLLSPLRSRIKHLVKLFPRGPQLFFGLSARISEALKSTESGLVGNSPSEIRIWRYEVFPNELESLIAKCRALVPGMASLKYFRIEADFRQYLLDKRKEIFDELSCLSRPKLGNHTHAPASEQADPQSQSSGKPELCNASGKDVHLFAPTNDDEWKKEIGGKLYLFGHEIYVQERKSTKIDVPQLGFKAAVLLVALWKSNDGLSPNDCASLLKEWARPPGKEARTKLADKAAKDLSAFRKEIEETLKKLFPEFREPIISGDRIKSLSNSHRYKINKSGLAAHVYSAAMK